MLIAYLLQQHKVRESEFWRMQVCKRVIFKVWRGCKLRIYVIAQMSVSLNDEQAIEYSIWSMIVAIEWTLIWFYSCARERFHICRARDRPRLINFNMCSQISSKNILLVQTIANRIVVFSEQWQQRRDEASTPKAYLHATHRRDRFRKCVDFRLFACVNCNHIAAIFSSVCSQINWFNARIIIHTRNMMLVDCQHDKSGRLGRCGAKDAQHGKSIKDDCMLAGRHFSKYQMCAYKYM